MKQAAHHIIAFAIAAVLIAVITATARADDCRLTSVSNPQ